MSRFFASYVEKAKQILDDNWMGSSTRPAPSLYPHQWNWDSAFIAVGRSHYDTSRAMLEIETLFDAQWRNGMVSQIVFNPDALGHLRRNDEIKIQGADSKGLARDRAHIN